MNEILEHEILKALFVRNGLHLGEPQIVGQKVVPIHKREFSDYTLHYGTLVDILNNPDKYPRITDALRGHIVFEGDAATDKYSWGNVSDAIELLILNEQVSDYVSPDRKTRTITLKPKGLIDYHEKYYLKERQT